MAYLKFYFVASKLKTTKMKDASINTIKIQTHEIPLDEKTSKMSLGHVFAERGCYLNELTLFIAHFNAIPNLISEERIDCKRANVWFVEKYHKEIRKHYFMKRNIDRSGVSQLDDIFYILSDDLIVDFDTNCSTVRFLFSKTEISEVEAIISEIVKFRGKPRKVNRLSLLVNSPRGIDIKSFEIVKPKLCIKDNYNEDFLEIHRLIMKRLSKINDKGLVLLHGRPGTGKTSYIRYLISSLKKKIIFLPPNMANYITNPDLISILIDNPNSVFVIEDAENIIMKREQGERSPVSTLLNISDGLLSDCLNVQIICSFNTDVSGIDEALLRKGRLIAKYEFKPLGTQKANLLSQKLGFGTTYTSPVTLTEIYNQAEKCFQTLINNQHIGFKLNAD